MDDSDLYQEASDEFDSQRDEALYTKALTLCDGDESKARFEYIRLRVQQIKGERQSSIEENFAALRSAIDIESAGAKSPHSRSVWEWFLYCIANYFSGHGRASRKEYWSFMLFATLFLAAAFFIDVAIGAYSEDIGLGLFSSIVGLGLVIPNFAVSVRRAHDLGRTGYISVLLLLPFLQWALMIYFLFPGEPEENQYGMDPTLS